jgi:hypothetical protein
MAAPKRRLLDLMAAVATRNSELPQKNLAAEDG